MGCGGGTPVPGIYIMVIQFELADDALLPITESDHYQVACHVKLFFYSFSLLQL